MNKITTILAGTLLIGALSACTTSNSTVGAVAGTGVGALAGGLIGHGNPVGIAVGAAAGGVSGYYIGKNTGN